MGLVLRKKVQKFISLAAALMLVGFTFGQSNSTDQMSTAPVYTFYPYMPEIGGELIYPLSNYALRDNFGGVYSVHGSFQFKLINRLYLGLEVQDNQISVATPVTFRVAIATTNMFFYNLGAKLAYSSSQSNNLIFSCSLTAGESWIEFNRMPANAPPPSAHGYGKNGIFFSPRVFEGYKVNDQLIIGVEITYTYVNYTFNPEYVGITTQYTNAQQSGATSFIGWGFGLQYLLGKAEH
jgi:hypothetical protein